MFFLGILKGVLHGAVMYMTIAFTFLNGGAASADGKGDADTATLAAAIGWSCTLITHGQILVITQHWTILHLIGIVCGPLGFICIFFPTYAWHDDWDYEFVSQYHGTLQRLFADNQFWCYTILASTVCTFPTFANLTYQRVYNPSPTDIVRQISINGGGDAFDIENYVPVSIDSAGSAKIEHRRDSLKKTTTDTMNSNTSPNQPSALRLSTPSSPSSPSSPEKAITLTRHTHL